MKTDYEWIVFRLVDHKPKTEVWSCENRSSGAELGRVQWYSAWRQYSFFPRAETVLNKTCLQDIVHFVQQGNDLHKDTK